MKHIVKFSILSLLLACCHIIVSCNTDKIDLALDSILERDSNGNYLFNASSSAENVTRTIRQNDGSIYWDKNESIKIFYDSQTYGVFTSTNQSVSATASFSGLFNNLVSDNDIAKNGIIALYPSQDAEYDDGNIIFTVPSSQEAEVGTFKKGLFPSIAKSKSSSLSFYNICGGIKLSVYYEGIKSITLKGNNSEYLAGQISASFSATGVPEYSVIDGVSEITLTAPQGEYFEVGKMYYIVTLPCTLLNGFTITYHTDNEDAKVKIDDTVTIHRSKFGLVLDKDVHGFVIHFDDPEFKASVVEQYDDNFDGEIDYIEAENVTNINCSNRDITSLEGVKYLVNLKSLNCSGNLLKEIDLSSLSKLTTLNCYENPIESLILDNCTSLTAMSIINATTNSISNQKVVIDGYQDSDKFVFSAKGTLYTDFSFINSDIVKTLDVSGDFTNSLNIYNIPNVTELKVGEMNVEVMNLHNLNLTSLDLTSNTNLKELYLQNNKLTSINLTKNTQLTKLNISDNNLQSINIRQNTLLTELKLNNNSSISTLNIDENLSLTTLEAEGLSISTIDMSQHSSLTDVKLRNNPKLRSMIIWDAATRKNDYLSFDMANVMVTDADGNNYGYPYTIGQYVPWFNGGIIYSLNDNGGGKMVCHRNVTPRYFDGYEWIDYCCFYYRVTVSDPDIPEMFYNNSETDGAQNMKDVYDYYNGYDKFVAYNSCATHSKDGRWYLPAIDELVELLSSNYWKVVTELINTNGDQLDMRYWSSTITDKGLVCTASRYRNSMDFYDEPNIGYFLSGSEAYNKQGDYARAIRKF